MGVGRLLQDFKPKFSKKGLLKIVSVLNKKNQSTMEDISHMSLPLSQKSYDSTLAKLSTMRYVPYFHRLEL